MHKNKDMNSLCPLPARLIVHLIQFVKYFIFQFNVQSDLFLLNNKCKSKLMYNKIEYSYITLLLYDRASLPSSQHATV